MKTPERTTAEVFPRYLGGEVVADSATLKWPGLFVRRYRFADSFARTVFFAMSQPDEVDVNEILFRPTRQEL